MSNHRKNSSFYHHGSSEPETEDFNFLASNNHEINGFMYENASSSDESQENNHGTLETEEIIQQNCAEINMKYIPKTMIKYINVLLIKQPENERELIPNLKVEILQNKGICLFSLIDVLKRLGFPLYQTMIFYLDILTNSFVYAGNDPIKQNIYIPINSRKYEISIKYRKPQINNTDAENKRNEETKSYERTPIRQERCVLPPPIENNRTLKKRIKERYIKEAIEKVNLWRNLHKQGFYDKEQNILVPLSLESAAQKVGISKKTLDDYLFQIRAGEKYGFNFEANYDQKIGVLRSFVRKKRTEDKGIKTRVGKKIYTENNINEVPKINKNIFQEDAEYNNITHNEQMLDEFYLNQKENNPNFFNFEENNQNFIVNEEEEFFNNNDNFDDFNKMDMEDYDYDVFRKFDRDN